MKAFLYAARDPLKSLMNGIVQISPWGSHVATPSHFPIREVSHPQREAKQSITIIKTTSERTRLLKTRTELRSKRHLTWSVARSAKPLQVQPPRLHRNARRRRYVIFFFFHSLFIKAFCRDKDLGERSAVELGVRDAWR